MIVFVERVPGVPEHDHVSRARQSGDFETIASIPENKGQTWRLLTLDLGCGDYDIVRPLKDGVVRAEGLEINFITINRPPEVHWRMGMHHEFDAAEMSFGSFVAGKARGDFPFVGIPAFVYRKFRHSCAYVNVDAGINKPEDLKGKRVGVPEWQMTATVWLRGFLQDDYGVRPRDIHWLTGGLESSERKEKVALKLPPEIKSKISRRQKSLRHVGRLARLMRCSPPRSRRLTSSACRK